MRMAGLEHHVGQGRGCGVPTQPWERGFGEGGAGSGEGWCRPSRQAPPCDPVAFSRVSQGQGLRKKLIADVVGSVGRVARDLCVVLGAPPDFS